MIGYFEFQPDQEESAAFYQILRRTAALHTDEHWEYYRFSSLKKALECLEQDPLLRLMNWDITVKDSLRTLAMVRRKQKEPMLLLVADDRISPMDYIRPGIRPEALLLKPYTAEDARRTLEDIISKMNMEGGLDSGTFAINTREERQTIPFTRIYYLEAKEKKIFVRTVREEWGYYGSLEEAGKRLPQTFARCHRSYFVNTDHIVDVDLNNNMVLLDHGIRIPFSRCYRKAMKEYHHGE